VFLTLKSHPSFFFWVWSWIVLKRFFYFSQNFISIFFFLCCLLENFGVMECVEVIHKYICLWRRIISTIKLTYLFKLIYVLNLSNSHLYFLKGKNIRISFFKLLIDGRCPLQIIDRVNVNKKIKKLPWIFFSKTKIFL
jgi:hypothetical protein